ncbi:hypothetical protein R0J91_18580, partial [Micrococcus sp. SIMBA_131]
FRKLAEAVTNRLCDYFPEAGQEWTRSAVLPGGDFENQDQLAEKMKIRFPWLPETAISRYVRTYGTSAFDFLQGCHSLADLGTAFT